MIEQLRTRLGMVVGCATLTLAAGCGDGDAANGSGPGGFPPMPVETATVRASGMTDRFTVVGSLGADEEITVVAEIAAVIMELPFREGAQVEKGSLIARLDDARALAEVQRAEALVQQRRTTHERVKAIVRENAGAPQDLDDAAANLAVAEADLAVARSQLEKTRIVAPFRGTIGAREVSVGSYLGAGQPITELAQLDELRVNFSAPELYLGRVDVGAPVQVRTTAHPGVVLHGTVDVINPVLDTASRSARIVAHIANEDRRLRPGMSAEVTVILAERPGALTVPGESVFFQGQQAFVYAVGADSTVSLAPVSLGSRGTALVEVLEGLEAGQSVVSSGHQKLFPGAKVMPVGGGDVAAETGS